MESINIELPSAIQPESSSSAPVTRTTVDSPAIRRLMEEVRWEDTNDLSSKAGYDRAHNRHNRS